MKLRPYSEYKDSGVPWWGEIPRHWEIISARQIGHLFKGSGGNKNDEVKKGVPCVRYGDLYTTHEFFILNTRACISPDNLKSYTRIRFGDVLFAASGETIEDIGRSAVNLIRDEACCGGDIIILRPTVEMDPRFLGYALESPAARYQKSSMGRGFTVVHIYGAELKSLVTTCPPVEEQTQIARFLDWKTAQIDRLIRNKRRLIELLKEQKQALINQAVIGRIDVRTGKPYPEYKDSGIPWLGKVPTHWELHRLRTIAKIRASNVDKHKITDETPVNLCNYTDVYNNKEITGALGLMEGTATLQEIRFFELKKGDVIITKDSETWKDIAVPAYVPDDLRNVVCGYHLALIRPFSPDIESEYLFWSFTSDPVADQFRISATGVTRFGLSQGAIKAALFPVPPSNEQQEISKFLRDAASKTEKAIEKLQREIELIQEYRTCLVADVVTGKLDVRGVEVPVLSNDGQASEEDHKTDESGLSDTREVAM